MIIKRIEKALEGLSGLKGKPKIFYSKQRKLSWVCYFSDDEREYVLKIPQRAVRGKGDGQVETQRKAEAEWISLNYFYDLADSDDCPINFVKPVAYLSELNGVVTEKVSGSDLHRLLKRDHRKLEKEKNRDLLRRVGAGLSFLQARQRKEVKKLKFKWKKTDDLVIDEKLKNIFEENRSDHFYTVESMTGFDIRDILVSEEGQVYLVDPGGVEKRYIYETVANLLSTLKILHQGDLFFPLRTVSRAYEKALVEGYLGDDQCDQKLLGVFVLAKITKLYKIARDRKLPHRFGSGKVLTKIYLDPFYKREIKKTIKEYGLWHF